MVLLAALSCAAAIEETGGRHSHLSNTTVQLHEHTLTIHLSSGYGAKGPLLVYLTGDGGWFGKDKELFNELIPAGYPLAGISARDYVSHIGSGVTQELPTHLEDDIAGVVAAADVALGLPADGPVVIVGKSRGAGLAVAAAFANSRLRGRLKGVLCVALTREEEYVYLPVPGKPDNSPLGMFQTYDALPLISGIPIAVIQSTNDNYIPAAQAKEFFGAEGPARRFRSIEADDHSFGGALDELYREVRASLQWIVEAAAAGHQRP